MDTVVPGISEIVAAENHRLKLGFHLEVQRFPAFSTRWPFVRIARGRSASGSVGEKPSAYAVPFIAIVIKVDRDFEKSDRDFDGAPGIVDGDTERYPPIAPDAWSSGDICGIPGMGNTAMMRATMRAQLKQMAECKVRFHGFLSTTNALSGPSSELIDLTRGTSIHPPKAEVKKSRASSEESDIVEDPIIGDPYDKDRVFEF
ncbi:hypothetical protein C8R44DRAFT_854507 [Mycena epipterygia]|nr:hypothetical protein C8R44DRAFT_854507 [Mycena epipterygia]